MQPASTFSTTLYFGRPSGIPYCRIIHGDMDCWLLWCATDMHFPMFWGADKNKNREWIIYIDIYPERNTKVLLIWRLLLSTGCKQWVSVLLAVLEIETINYPNFWLPSRDFGPFKGIFGPSIQLPSPIAL